MKPFGKSIIVLIASALIFISYGCGNEEHVNIFHVTFTANGVSKDFTTKVGFTKLINSYSISYYINQDDLAKNWLYLYLPATVSANTTYTSPSSNCTIIYYDANGTAFDARNYGSTLTITVTEWPGPGGYARGTFSGTLTDSTYAVSAILASGTFEGFIHN